MGCPLTPMTWTAVNTVLMAAPAIPMYTPSATLTAPPNMSHMQKTAQSARAATDRTRAAAVKALEEPLGFRKFRISRTITARPKTRATVGMKAWKSS